MSGCLDRKDVRGAIWGVHSTGTGQPVKIQDVFFWHLAGRSVPTGLAIVHWIGCINAIKLHIHSSVTALICMFIIWHSPCILQDIDFSII